ncbi:MAG: YraN family protein [Akkermansia sp.]
MDVRLCRLLSRLHLLHRLRGCGGGEEMSPGALGRYSELVAASWLRSRGHRVLRLSWRWSARGEIDIVSREGDTLVFSEVKCTRYAANGAPLYRVDRDKRERLRLGARDWLHLLGRSVPARFDIIEVFLYADARPQLRLHRDAFGMHERSAVEHDVTIYH